jgi:hypothetical protein
MVEFTYKLKNDPSAKKQPEYLLLHKEFEVYNNVIKDIQAWEDEAVSLKMEGDKLKIDSEDV